MFEGGCLDEESMREGCLHYAWSKHGDQLLNVTTATLESQETMQVTRLPRDLIKNPEGVTPVFQGKEASLSQ